MPDPSLLLQDACVLINLLATGRFEEIAGGIGLKMAVAQRVAAEAIFLLRPDTGEREPIGLQQYIDAGLLSVLSLETDQERSLFVAYAAELDDGEAMSLALAECRHLALATDDRKARRLISEQHLSLELWSTVDILKRWEVERHITKDEMRRALELITARASFRLKPSHPDSGWWNSFER